MYGLCLVNDTWVVIVHTVDISPDLDFLSINGSTNEGGRIVTATTLQIIYLTISITTDKALCQIYLLTFVLLKEHVKFFLNIGG